jgi:hypothetical protein
MCGNGAWRNISNLLKGDILYTVRQQDEMLLIISFSVGVLTMNSKQLEVRVWNLVGRMNTNTLHSCVKHYL